MAMLAGSVQVARRVDTHKHPPTAAVLAAATGPGLAGLTVATTPDGDQHLLELADPHHRQRVGAIQGPGGPGAGLTRSLPGHQEHVVGLDRPTGAARRPRCQARPAGRDQGGPRRVGS